MFFALAVVPIFHGCAVVRVQEKKVTERSLRAEAGALREGIGGGAAERLWQANRENLAGGERLELLLDAARLADGAEAGSDGEAVRSAAIAQIVSLMALENFAPMRIGEGNRFLRVRKSSRHVLDPATCDHLVAASNLEIGGLRVRTARGGEGVAYAAWFSKNSPAMAGQPGVPRAGMSMPVTAVLEFGGAEPELIFYRTMDRDVVEVNGRMRELAVDYSAPLAVLATHGRNRSIDLQALFFSDRNIDNAGLFQFEPFSPGKIPVVFVHGLMSRPEAWMQAVNEALADPEIRSRYQFWFYLYPTGLPVWWSAAKLRGEMDRFREVLDADKKNANLDRVVLVGHSMGGIISSLLVRDGGERLWGQFSDVPVEELRVSEATRKTIREFVEFGARKDVGRVIYFATPHQGSKLALNPVAGFFAKLVRLPATGIENDRFLLVQSIRDDMRSVFVAPANSIRFLRAKSPLLLSIQNLPIRGGVPYHSIIGDRGRGNSPNSTDGVVPYWSSHLPGAASEKIVPSGHGANEHPEGILEMRRILLENLNGAAKGAANGPSNRRP